MRLQLLGQYLLHQFAVLHSLLVAPPAGRKLLVQLATAWHFAAGKHGSALAPGSSRAPLQRWSATVEDKHGAHAMEEQPAQHEVAFLSMVLQALQCWAETQRQPRSPADASEEAQQVGVVDDLAPLVPHSSQELMQPY